MTGIPVLMYHALEDADHPAGAKDPGEQLYVLQVGQFREQMEYLHKEGYTTYLLDELKKLNVWPDKTVVLTFDDGHESNFTLALPILQEFGFKAHFFITTGWIGTPHFMTAEQIRGLYQAGMVIGSHGVTHRFLTDAPVQDVESELHESMHSLASMINGPVISFSAPGGRISSETISVADKLGYTIKCTSEPALAMDSSVVPRFALTCAMSQQTFVKIVRKSSVYLGKTRFLNSGLSLAKTILGNERYVKCRDILLRAGKP